MSMNWTQYLLGKLAEEATEVAKEALKCQQQGVGSPYKGKPAIMELRNEFIECLAVIEMLEERKDVGKALGAHRIAPATGHDVCQDDDYVNISLNKIYRLCYYAMIAYQSGNLELTRDEFKMVVRNANEYITLTGKPSVNGIAFRGTGMGSYYRETLVDNEFDPLATTKSQISAGSGVREAIAVAPRTTSCLQMPADQVEYMKKAIALVDDLIVAEWQPMEKPEAQKTRNADGTLVYSWAERDKNVRVYLHVKLEHYDITHTDINTGRHISTDRGEYKTF